METIIVDKLPEGLKYLDLEKALENRQLLYQNVKFVMIKAKTDNDLKLDEIYTNYDERYNLISIPEEMAGFFKSDGFNQLYTNQLHKKSKNIYCIQTNTKYYGIYKDTFSDKAVFEVVNSYGDQYLILKYLEKRDTTTKIRELEKEIEKLYAMNRSLLDTINMFHSTEENMLK